MKQETKWLLAAISCCLVLAICGHQTGHLSGAVGRIAAFSAALQLPDGFFYQKPPHDTSLPSSAVSQAPSAISQPVTALPETPPEGVETGQVKTTTLSLSAANLKGHGVHINNKTDRSVDVSNYLKQGLPFSLETTDQPQVLIVHTHATESYINGDRGYYIKSASTRSTDNTQNTVSVGEVMAQVLNQAGIVTIHDETQHDYPNYTGSYTRSAETIRHYLKQYPSIKVVIDGHRDAIAGEGDTKIKPTATINGKSAAQIMILAGCETGSVEDFPHWEENLRFCLQLQKQIEADYPGLARPLLFKACKYNFHLLSGSILIEIGTDANTLDEAKYSAKLLAEALKKVLT